ncbi:MAG TPA: ornithine--oxo-acid transaminase [Aggregatilineaceae bacterium]|nr:ornithine--oxo-acid transaminase [Aggregatilineaceae bacterium]
MQTAVSMTSQDYIDLEERYGAHNYHPLDIVVHEASGVWVTDVEGKRYLDCLSAYSALNQGHAHPKIQQAVIEQIGRVTLTSRAFRNDQLGPFYKELSDLTGYAKILPMNSGTEAVETALKLARKWGYKIKGIPESRAEIIVCEGNFHGRTIAIISASTEAQYRDGFGPFTPGFKVIPYGDADALEAAITPNTAAFLVEPLQGEAGVIVPRAGFLKRAAEICKQHNVLLLNDEVQTGLGRTGKLFLQDHEGVRADVLILGKALSGGFYPVSAVLADETIMAVLHPGDHGSTFGGNPLACAIARAALRVIVEENLIENAAVLGEYFQDQLAEINSPHIKEVRGRGLLIGVELKPEAGGARRFCQALFEHGVLCKETHVNTLRFAPPLVIRKEDIDWALERIRPVMLMK